MYIPASFRQTRTERLHDLIRRHPLGLLVSHGENGLQASPIPFLLYPDEGAAGVLRAHVAKANAHWKALIGCGECLVVFQGNEGYVTPNWYPSKAETHKTVPTWNYAMVEVRGTPGIIDDTAWLHRQLRDLTKTHEASRPQPWSIDQAPSDFLAAQMQAIVGIELPISHIEGKWKMSQNRSAADRNGVIQGMQSAGDAHRNDALAKQMSEDGD